MIEVKKLGYDLKENLFNIEVFFSPEQLTTKINNELAKLFTTKYTMIRGPLASLKGLYYYKISFVCDNPKEKMNELFNWKDNSGQMVVWKISDDVVERTFSTLFLDYFRMK